MPVFCGFCRGSAHRRNSSRFCPQLHWGTVFCSGFHEAKYDFRAIQNYSENEGMRWVLQDKQGTPELVFSENVFQRFEEFLGRARSSDARQFHMNNCCFTAGFRALSPSALSFADSLGGKSVFISVKHLLERQRHDSRRCFEAVHLLAPSMPHRRRGNQKIYKSSQPPRSIG